MTKRRKPWADVQAPALDDDLGAHPTPWTACRHPGSTRFDVFDRRGDLIAQLVPRSVAVLLCAAPKVVQAAGAVLVGSGDEGRADLADALREAEGKAI